MNILKKFKNDRKVVRDSFHSLSTTQKLLLTVYTISTVIILTKIINSICNFINNIIEEIKSRKEDYSDECPDKCEDLKFNEFDDPFEDEK